MNAARKDKNLEISSPDNDDLAAFALKNDTKPPAKSGDTIRATVDFERLEHAAIKMAATSQGITLSALVRKILAKDPGVAEFYQVLLAREEKKSGGES